MHIKQIQNKENDMATQSTSGQRRSAAQRRKKKKTRNIIILVVEVLILFIMLGVLWFVIKATDKETGMQKVEIPSEEVIINEEVVENEVLETYRTIALFGLDSTVGELTSNTRSDTIMVASVNSETKEVRLMSVYRDTYLNLGNDTYNKCNAAYAKGGPKQAINMLNMNLDLDITDFVAVGFKGVTDVVDAVGGVWIEVDEAELEHINNYVLTISENLKVTNTPVKSSGYQKLNGIQATAYCRIRYTAGDDFKRTQRQREVLSAILDEAKKMDVTSLVKIANNVFGNVYTSIDLEEILALLGDLASYTLIDEGGFPSLEYRTTATLGKGVGDSVICTDLEEAVVDFHKRFFANEEYTPSEALKEISKTIHQNTDAYIR
jgi:LCP family protein required for cell wall assembly